MPERPPRRRALTLPQFVPERTPMSLDKMADGRKKGFEALGFAQEHDVGFVPVLTERSLLRPEMIPAELTAQQVSQWAREGHTLLGLHHAVFLQQQKAAMLRRMGLTRFTIHFFGTQYRKDGRLYVPVIHSRSLSSIRLDPIELRRKENDVVLRVGEE